MKIKLKVIGLALLSNVLLYADLSLAQSEPIAYPAKGQSMEQQQQDHYACYQWARQQTGVDPANMSLPTAQTPPSSPGQGSVVRGAAGGAAIGAAGGAIAGNAGQGAAIGAGVGAATGLVRRARHQDQASQTQAQASSQQQQAMQLYYRAWTACMQGRGYTVN